MMNKSGKGVSIVESKNGEYCFLEESEQIPEEFHTYEYIDLSACDSMEDLLSAIIDANLSELVLIGGKETETLFRVLIHRLHWIDEKLTVRVRIEDRSKHADNAMKEAERAVHTMLTGKFAKSEEYHKAKQIFVSDSHFLDKMELCNDMDFNSEVFLPLSEYKEEAYRNWKRSYYNHIHFIGDDSVYLDGKEQQIPLLQAGYAKWIEYEESRNYYVALENEEDYRKLILDLDYMKETGKIRNHHFYLKNECRWMGQCNLLSQKRYTIKSENKASICESAQSFSFRGDAYKLHEERVKAMEDAKQKRHCEHCAVNAWCTKCSGLSPELEKCFCNTMQNHLSVIDFIQIKNALLKLEQLEHKGHRFCLEELSFASYAHNLVLSTDMQSKKPITHKTYVFETQGEYFYFDSMNMCVQKITQEEAFVMEAILKGYSCEATREAFIKKYAKNKFQMTWKNIESIL